MFTAFSGDPVLLLVQMCKYKAPIDLLTLEIGSLNSDQLQPYARSGLFLTREITELIRPIYESDRNAQILQMLTFDGGLRHDRLTSYVA